MNLCKYSKVLGIPKQGIHRYRLFNLAIMDVIMTIIAAWIISYTWKLVFLHVLIGLFIIGILLHRLFCVNTTIDRFLFG